MTWQPEHELPAGISPGGGSVIQSRDVNTVPLIIRAIAGQAVASLEIQNSAGDTVTWIGPTGTIFATLLVAFGNTQLGGFPQQFGGGYGVVGIRNADTVPSSNAPDGGIVYVEGGALKYRGSGGTVTTIAPA